jgi:hypothetical protein
MWQFARDLVSDLVLFMIKGTAAMGGGGGDFDLWVATYEGEGGRGGGVEVVTTIPNSFNLLP